MFPLVLKGYSVDLNVNEGKLLAREWYFDGLKGQERKHILKPRQHTYDSLFVISDRGKITVSALDWLQKYGIPATFLDTKGKIRNQINTYQPNGKLRLAQFQACADTKRRLQIGKEIIRAKLTRQNEVIEYLKQRYDISENLSDGIKEIDHAKTTKEILGIEGITANRYFEILKQTLQFPDRDNGFTHRPMNSIEPVNSLLNYGYELLASMIRHSLNKGGLETSIGYIHEIQPGKEPLVYDIQEPFRFLIDLTVIRIIEQNLLLKKDYTHNKDWIIRLTESGVNKLLNEIQATFNVPVKYKNKGYRWDTVIDLQIRDLANSLLNDTKPDFSSPKIQLKRRDSIDIRDKIRNMSYAEWKAKGYSKGSLHYLKHNLNKPNFKVYRKVREKFT